MKGWTYEDVDALPVEVYETLVDMLVEEANERERTR